MVNNQMFLHHYSHLSESTVAFWLHTSQRPQFGMLDVPNEIDKYMMQQLFKNLQHLC